MTITLNIDNSDYCQSDMPLPAFPVPLNERENFTVGKNIDVYLPPLHRTLKTRVESIEVMKVSSFFEEKPIPPEFQGHSECQIITLWIL